MVKRTAANVARKITNEENSLNASSLHASRKSSNEKLPNDDLIVSLSDAYENKRAQQVVEWENVQPLNMQRAA